MPHFTWTKLQQIVLGAAMVMMVTAGAAADEGEAQRSIDPGSTITFALENDLFAGHDDGYTNGVCTSYVSPGRYCLARRFGRA